MLKDLNSILDYIDRLNQLDTSNVEPMAQAASRHGERKDQADGFSYAMRSDELRPCLSRRSDAHRPPPTEHFLRCPK